MDAASQRYLVIAACDLAADARTYDGVRDGELDDLSRRSGRRVNHHTESRKRITVILQNQCRSW